MKERGVWIATFVALLAAMASNGKPALEALGGLPRVLQAFATGLPLGLVSFALALAVAMLAWWHIDYRLHTGHKDTANDFRADTLALLVAIAATMLQTVVVTLSPGALLQALMLGILAGLLAPLGARLVSLILRRVLL